jgi:hypothetical protein
MSPKKTRLQTVLRGAGISATEAASRNQRCPTVLSAERRSTCQAKCFKKATTRGYVSWYMVPT